MNAPLPRRLLAPALLLSMIAIGGCASESAVTGERVTAAPEVEPVATVAAPPATTAAATARSRPGSAAAGAPTVGTMVAATGSLRSFDPVETDEAVRGLTLNLRERFRELGPEAIEWYQHVQTLASPFFEGRAPGTEGIEHAADYIEFNYRQCGLEPAFPDPAAEGTGALTSYRQPFEFASPRPTVEVERAALAAGDMELVVERDFALLGNSARGTAAAPITFVGYSIAAGPDDYTSFAEDTDLTGRIALVLRYEPLDEAGKSQWSTNRFSRRAALAPKLRAATERGAAGILLVNPPGAVDGSSGLETTADSGRFGRRLDVPVMQITPETADRLLAEGDPEGRDLATLRRLADTGAITTVDLKDDLEVEMIAELTVDDRLATENVGAILRGRGRLADEWIVIGGHYDHVGYGYTGAVPSNFGQLHPGADDNASGTAGVIIAARRLSRRYAEAPEDAELRSILFLSFSAEEAGLHGSRHFVEHSSIPLDRTSLMINFDMIGRLRSDSVTLQGTGTAAEFETLLPPHVASSGLTIMASPGGTGPSDHTNFHANGVPVLFPFTGMHDDYHQPSDEAYTVNPAGAIKVLDFVDTIVTDVASRPEALTFVENTSGGMRRTGAKVRLGIMPAYGAELETGLLVEQVSEGTSADLGGMEAGDIILSWDGQEIDGGRALFERLGKHEPGDMVKIVVQRGDEELTLDIRLQGRE